MMQGFKILNDAVQAADDLKVKTEEMVVLSEVLLSHAERPLFQRDIESPEETRES